MNCKDASAALQNACDAGERPHATLLAHIATCPACEAQLNRLQALRDQLAAGPAVPAGLVAGIQRRIAHESGPRVQPHATAQGVLALLAAVALTATAGWWMSGRYQWPWEVRDALSRFTDARGYLESFSTLTDPASLRMLQASVSHAVMAAGEFLRLPAFSAVSDTTLYALAAAAALALLGFNLSQARKIWRQH